MASRAKERDYLAIAKRSVTTPKLLKSFRRLLVYGRNKKGKSTFATSAGRANTLVIDAEHGTDTMLKKNPYVWHVSKWQDLQDVMGAIRLGTLSPASLGVGPETEPFSWLVPDTLTRFNNLALRHIMSIEEDRNLDRKPGLVDRRDYFKSGELMKEFLMQAHSLPINICYTAQERMKSIGSIEEDDDSAEADYVMVPDLPDAVRGAANSWVEVIGRIYTVPVEVKEKTVQQRRLWIAPNDRYDTGYRSDFVLPDFLRAPTIPKLVKMMEEGYTPPAPRKKVA